MKLSSMHQLLIAMAMGLAAIFALRASYFAISHGDLTQAVLALVSVVTLGLLWRYLRRFRAKLAAASPSPNRAETQETRPEETDA